LDATGETRSYDEVVFASHADDTLSVLADPSAEERKALGAIGYQRNVAVLHRDPSVMPKNKRCWASWVYRSDGQDDGAQLSVTYWMNSLQGIDDKYPLFVTLNPSQPIADEYVFDRHVFMHPVFDLAAHEAQSQLTAMQGARKTWFCGAHMGYGFHEDGLVSAMRVARALGAAPPWAHGPVGQIRRAPAAAGSATTAPPVEAAG